MIEETFPRMVVSLKSGEIVDVPHYLLTGMSGMHCHLPSMDELIRLPAGSDLFSLPGRMPIGYNSEKEKMETITEFFGEPVSAVAAFLAPAYTQLLRASYVETADAPMLPLYAYTAVGWWKDHFVVPAVRVDPDPRQDLPKFDPKAIEEGVKLMVKKFRKNRLVQHLINNCVRRYCCPAARNFVLQRYEFPVPTSTACNAHCDGCLSHQPPSSEIVSPMQRIQFIPSVEEIVEYTVPHLQTDRRAVISFGQGCEGEPLLQAELLESSIKEIRKKTSGGIINLNTNGSLPHVVEKLCVVGLDSVRISVNSLDKKRYHHYFKPKGYTFEDVIESIRICKKYGKWVSINYFVYPGLTDLPSEYHLLSELIKNEAIDMIQTRNLNYDPERYYHQLRLERTGEIPMGMTQWFNRVKTNFPDVMIGYFNPPKETMRKLRRK